ncbi:MAG: purine-nucleoside phosphorylase [Acidobacteriota bacterium]|nr:purine-nucleoside phosphorylase [Acidobacteriota bacterium]MDH3523463.1 purine-nucleoside phosphorylase [Acidobacteriota bacterium]
MLDLYDKIQEACRVIRAVWAGRPRAGLVLGTGLGGLVDAMEVAAAVDYGDIPHFPRSTALSHAGRLVLGSLDGVEVVVMQGRFHKYEGYPLAQVTLPVRVMHALGAELLVVSQAAGGLNPYYASGDVMVIDDQINLLGDNPLIGVNDDRLGPRFPDMSAPYDPELIAVALAVARREDFVAHRGVTVAVTGPCLETRAEYRFLRAIGADVVGMSTIPETIVAVHEGMKVFGLSVVTDMCLPDALAPADPAHIVTVAGAAAPRMAALVRGVLAHWAARG